MFPNAVMLEAGTWRDILSHDDRSAQRPRLGLMRHDKKILNIGLVGYGFMGRTHSNAFLQAGRFFDLPYRPVLKAVCARNAERANTFAENWGYESIETDWRTARRPQGYRPHRHRQPQRHARRNCDRRGPRRKDGAVRKAARAQCRGRRSDDGSGGSRQSPQHGLVQLPPRARRHVDQATARRRTLRPHLPLPRKISAGLDHLAGPCRKAAKDCGAWISMSPEAA